MARASWFTTLTDDFGNILTGGEVEVRDTGGALPSLFDAATGGSSVANPVSPDSDGLVFFYLDPGTYDFTVSIGATETMAVRETVLAEDNGAENSAALGQGTAATTDTGTALTEVPTGKDLADGLKGGHVSGDLILPWFKVPIDSGLGDTDEAVLLLARDEAGATRTGFSGDLIIQGNPGTGSGRSIHCAVQAHATAGGDPSIAISAMEGASFNHETTLAPVSCTFGGEDWLGVRLTGASFAWSTNSAGYPYLRGVLFTQGAGFLPKLVSLSDCTNVSVNRAGSHQGRPGDSIGNNGALRNTNQVLGEATDFSQGTDTKSGDGSTTTFTVAHGLGNAPTSVNVTPESAAAADKFYVSGYDSTNITLEYATAPASATDNLAWSFQAYREA